MNQKSNFIVILLAILFFASTAHAERKYIFGVSLDLTGGAGNQLGTSRYSHETIGKDIIPFYAVYPGVTLQSVGAHSTLQLNYAFAGQRYEIDNPITTTSHSFTVDFDSQLGKRVNLKLSNSFSSVPTISVLRTLKDIITTPEGFQFVFEPDFYKRTRLGDTARISLDIDLSEKSYLTFEGSGSYLRYKRDVVSTGYLSDQYREEGGVSFSHRSSERATWTVEYRMHQNQIKGYADARSHIATIGSNLELSPTVQLALEAGPSYTEKSDDYSSYTGYFAHATLSKQIRKHSAWIHYSHNPGDSTGLGPITDSHQGGVGLSLALSRTTKLNLDASAYKQDQRKNLAFDYWGAQGTSSLSQAVGTHWFASIGFSYGVYEGRVSDTGSIAYRQAFVSFGFRFPELWRSMK